MKQPDIQITPKVITVSCILSALLACAVLTGLSTGSAGSGFSHLWNIATNSPESNPVIGSIILKIRLPRIFMAAMCGAVLSLGGLVFQALLRNPLAEPYILGISGGSAIGAIIGITLGLSRFPGIGLTAFTGSMASLAMVIFLASGERASSELRENSVILSGVMVNAFCSAVIMFLISVAGSNKLHNIMFWLMGDLSSSDTREAIILAACVTPCFAIIFLYSHKMNLLLLGDDIASSMGINTRKVTFTLLGITSFMVSAAVCQSGLMGFVGLVVPHLLRMLLGPDHRVLVPASILGGASFMVLCDSLARWIPEQGEMPTGVITAMIGAPLFIMLLKKGQRR